MGVGEAIRGGKPVNNRCVPFFGAISLWLALTGPNRSPFLLLGCGSVEVECFPDLFFELFVDRMVIWPKCQEMCFGPCTSEESH